MIYGGNVMCTNGLFHMFDDNHNEIYINRKNSELDKRAKYKTVVVMDKIVVAQVVNSNNIAFVVLDKTDLNCIYKTQGIIQYLNNDIVYSIDKDKVVFISRNGKTLITLSGKRVQQLNKYHYLVSSGQTFNDMLLAYNDHRDTMTNLTKDKNYLIYPNKNGENSVDIISMHGGRYKYNFDTHRCTNLFTGKEEEIQLWTLQ
jgi:hypothetical protein